MFQTDLRSTDLKTIVLKAWEEGQKVDLRGIGYGRIHWGNKTDVIDETIPYYHFLAGIVRIFKFSRILEIGTHWGGATRAMWNGLEYPDDSTVVTVDITSESDNRLKPYTGIKKIVGDANTEEMYLKVMSAFNAAPVDLVYVDADHRMIPTITSFALYGAALRPRIMIFDDITWNDSMNRAWELMRRSLPAEDTINAAEVVPAIRPSPDHPGFGVVRISNNF